MDTSKSQMFELPCDLSEPLKNFYVYKHGVGVSVNNTPRQTCGLKKF